MLSVHSGAVQGTFRGSLFLIKSVSSSGDGAQEGNQFVRHFSVSLGGGVVTGPKAVEKQHLAEFHAVNLCIAGFFFVFLHNAENVIVKIVAHASQTADDFCLGSV